MMQYPSVICVLAILNLVPCLALQVPTEPGPAEAGQCIDSLHVAEQVIAGSPYNLDSIKSALYPLNSHPALAITVNFYFNATLQNTSSVPVHPATIAGQRLNLEPDYVFQWLSAPIFLPLGMEVVEVFGIVFISIAKYEAYVVLSPVCEEYAADILSKVTEELQVFPNMVNYKARGFAVEITHKNDGSSTTRSIHYNQRAAGSNSTMTDKTIQNLGPCVFLFLMAIIPYINSIGWAIITPLLLQKQQLVLTPNQVVQDSSQLKTSIFLGLTVVCFFAAIGIVLYDSALFHLVGKVWIFYVLLPVPVALPFLLFFDILFGLRAMRITEKLYNLKHKTASSERLHFFKVLTVIESVIITLFLQIVSFHAHWFLLMLVSFPMEVGSILFAYTTLFCCTLFFASAVIHSIFGCTCGSTSIFRADELQGIATLFWGLSMFALVYCITVVSGGVNYHDGMSSLMPNFLPIIIIGVSLWLFKTSKIIEKPPGAEEEEQHLEEKLKLLTEEEA